MERGGSYIHVASAEKAALDMVYFGQSPPDVELDIAILREMAERFSALNSPRARRVVKWVRGLAD
jgi:hypothetical protein